MDQVSLVNEWKEAGKQFLEEFQKTYAIKAAFWVKSSEDTPWYLYVTSDQFDAENLDTPYAEVLRSARRLQTHFDPFRVKLVGPDEPITKSVLEIQSRQHGPFPTVYGGSHLGDMSVEGAYFYPVPLST